MLGWIVATATERPRAVDSASMAASKRPVWYVNAARRTVLSLLPSFAKPDDVFARDQLEVAEYALYLRMDPRDRQHACEVARRLSAACPSVSPELLAAALLHDVGKSCLPFRLDQRILAHLLPTGDTPPEPRLRGLAGALQVKRHHHAYGAAMVRSAGGRERVAALVAGHHGATFGASDHADAMLLRAVDDAT